jgi:Uma2 family endonuclease
MVAATTIFRNPQTDEVIYPETDGQPMAESTTQYNLITMLKDGIDALFADRDDIFTAADLFWYPVKGNSGLRVAPDVMVVFGRPRGDRSSYKQWEEENLPPNIVIEIISHSNTPSEMMDKLEFYDFYGVEEYYTFDPIKQKCNAWHRNNGHLQYLYEQTTWYSPRLEVTFALEPETDSPSYGLRVTRSDGTRFEMLGEVRRQLKLEKQRAEQEKQRAEQEKQRADALAERLRAMGVNPDDVA